MAESDSEALDTRCLHCRSSIEMHGSEDEDYPCIKAGFYGNKYTPYYSIITTGKHTAEGANPAVDHPQHYNIHPAGIECIDVIRPMGFSVGTAIKHLWRAGLKPDNDEIQDIEKAIWYLNDHLNNLREPTGRTD